MILIRITIFWMALYMAMIAKASAAGSAQCDTVTFADTGWNEVTVATALAATVLKGLDYEVEIKPLTPAATYPALASDKVDVFLGNWNPTLQVYEKLYRDESAIDIIRTNLTGARYSLATNPAGATLGIADISDIAKHKTALKNKIYGAEPGNPGNTALLDIIAQNEHDLGTFELVASSMEGMLRHVKQADEPVIFIAWEPEPEITNISPAYLSGGGDIFGAAEVQTVTRAGYAEECQNIGSFLRNFEITPAAANELIAEMTTKNITPDTVTKNWLKRNPETVAVWLAAMTTAGGNDPHSALQIYLDG